MSDEAPHQNRHSIEVYVWTSLTSTEPNRNFGIVRRIVGFAYVSDSFGLDVTAHKQYYYEQMLSSIVGTIGSRHNLSIAVQASNSRTFNYVQYGESD
ncbi:hypothetical protein [Granulicella mallensis]|jgi:phage protein D|uniref:Phage protein D n=1 Tax=Granulicella mallensis TaxID=940614 RepID=A0A7W7ZP97_9BACT|nr:hypothetical protein [Granulicella mallensis]MBB5063239.1 phage protein D [Granulicella mallensis]